MYKKLDYRKKTWLEKQYVKEKRSLQSLALECGVDKGTIRYWLRKHGLEIKKQGRQKQTELQKLDKLMEDVERKEELYRQYRFYKDFINDTFDQEEEKKRVEEALKEEERRRNRKRVKDIERMGRRNREAGINTGAIGSIEEELRTIQWLHDKPGRY